MRERWESLAALVALAAEIDAQVGGDLTAFIADCTKEDDCPLPKDQLEAKIKITSIFTASATNPFPRKFKVKNDNRTATEAMIVLGTLSALYDDVDGWPKLRTALSEGLQGYGDSFLDLVGSTPTRGHIQNLQQEALCLEGYTLALWLYFIVRSEFLLFKK